MFVNKHFATLRVNNSKTFRIKNVNFFLNASIIFKGTRTYRDIFKSALVYLKLDWLGYMLGENFQE